MNIREIKDPSFLKEMNIDELQELSDEIRSFLIESVSKTGGHLASNLGVVELTVAMHYVFDAPKDRILFDVGHQSYVHKILTGRADRMDTLRQYRGLSGFQKRSESIYDCFEAGHSSTSLSAGLGMAIARDLDHEDYQVVVVIGDGALNSGLSLEALNEIGFEKRNMVIIFNDNNMSISRNVGALTKGFASLRSSKGYVSLKENIKSVLAKQTFGESTIKGIHNFKEAIKKTVLDSGVFKEFGIDYIGPVDGHDIKEMIRAFDTAKRKGIPCVVHCVTTKGKGYPFAEADRTGKWHGVPRFDIATGKPLNAVPEGYASYSAIISDAVFDLMKEYKDIVTITPAMISGSALGKIFSAYPERSFDCGIAEDHALELSAGLALNGKRPFVSIYSSFLQRAYDQLNHDLCRMDLPVVLGVDRAGIVGEDGNTHHGVFDISIARSLPNIVIAEGKDAAEMRDLLAAAFSQKHPFLLRYPRGTAKIAENDEFHPIPVGKWEKLVNNDNAEAAVITYGPDADTLSGLIRENHLPYDLINARFLKPIDEEILKEVFEKNIPVYVYTADILKGGLGDEILEFCNRDGLKPELHLIGIDDTYVAHGSILQLKEELSIDIRSLFAMIEKGRHA